MRLIQHLDRPLEPEEFSIHCNLRELRDLMWHVRCSGSHAGTDTVTALLQAMTEIPAGGVSLPSAINSQPSVPDADPALRSPTSLRRAKQRNRKLTADRYPPVLVGPGGDYVRGWPAGTVGKTHTEALLGAVPSSEPRAQATGRQGVQEVAV